MAEVMEKAMWPDLHFENNSRAWWRMEQGKENKLGLLFHNHSHCWNKNYNVEKPQPCHISMVKTHLCSQAQCLVPWRGSRGWKRVLVTVPEWEVALNVWIWHVFLFEVPLFQTYLPFNSHNSLKPPPPPHHLLRLTSLKLSCMSAAHRKSLKITIQPVSFRHYIKILSWVSVLFKAFSYDPSGSQSSS